MNIIVARGTQKCQFADVGCYTTMQKCGPYDRVNSRNVFDIYVIHRTISNTITVY
jgi:hypothetical protein